MTTKTSKTSTSTPADFEADYVERRTWRDALDSLLALVGMGEDVDPAELSETKAKAEAETTVESGRQGWVERKRAEKARKDAAVLADEIAATIDPECHVKGLAEAKAAWDNYVETVVAVKGEFGEHDNKVRALLKAVADSGAPSVDAKSTAVEVPDAAVLKKPMSGVVPVWRGVTYGYTRLAGSFLPHRAPRRDQVPAFVRIDEQG